MEPPSRCGAVPRGAAHRSADGHGRGTGPEVHPARARELAAALVRAADEAERAEPAEPVTVEARELRRGDVRAGDRSMTVERVRPAGTTTQVTWRSDTGRTWTQDYTAGTAIGLRRRG